MWKMDNSALISEYSEFSSTHAEKQEKQKSGITKNNSQQTIRKKCCICSVSRVCAESISIGAVFTAHASQ